MSKKTRHVLVGFAAFVLLSPSPAYAYLDQGTASLIVQAVIALAVGAATATKLYWKKISRSLFPKRAGDESE
jgi:hypothetical protein